MVPASLCRSNLETDRKGTIRQLSRSGTMLDCSSKRPGGRKRNAYVDGGAILPYLAFKFTAGQSISGVTG